MVFTEKHFVYDGVNSRQFNLIIAHIDTNVIQNLSGEVEIQKFFNRNTTENYIIGQRYDDSNLEIDIEFISEEPLSRIQQRKIKKWLFNRSEYKKLYIDKSEDEELERINGEIKQCYVNCIFTSPEIIEFDGVYGYKAKMQLSSPFAFQDEIVIEQTNQNSGYEDTDTPMYVKVDVDSDIDGFIYPIIITNRVTKYPSYETEETLSTTVGNYKIVDTTQPISDTNSEIYVDEVYRFGQYAEPTQDKSMEKLNDNNECSVVGKTITAVTIRYILNSRNEIAEKEISGSPNPERILINVKDGKFIKLYNGTNYLRFEKNIHSVLIKYQNVRYIR